LLLLLLLLLFCVAVGDVEKHVEMVQVRSTTQCDVEPCRVSPRT
jgi:hypothetical protein